MLAACADLNSIYRQRNLNENVVVSVDAKQRFLIKTKRKDDLLVACAEPSPDVFSVYAAALEASSSTKSEAVAHAFNLTTGETGATIGLRTESIQLLRDAMYRLCEAYAAEGINSDVYGNLLGKYQKSMVTLIAISQLTRAVQPQQVTIGASGAISGSPELLIQVQAEINSAESELEKSKKAEEEKGKALSDLGAELAGKCSVKPIDPSNTKACEPYNASKKESVVATDKRIKAENKLKRWMVIFEKAESSTLSTTSQSNLIRTPNEPLTQEAIEVVSKTVENLVAQVFFSDSIELCVNKVLRQGVDQNTLDTHANVTGAILKDCLNRLLPKQTSTDKPPPKHKQM